MWTAPYPFGRTHGCDAIGTIDFSNRTIGFWALGAVHRTALNKHGRNNIAATTQVVQNLLEQVAWLNMIEALIPQVTMSITDGKVAFKAVFLKKTRPMVVRCQVSFFCKRLNSCSEERPLPKAFVVDRLRQQST